MDAATFNAMKDYFAKNPGALQYQDPNGSRYSATYSGGSPDQGPGTLVGYSGADGAYHAGQHAQSYDTNGQQTGDWAAEDPSKKSWVDALPYIIAAGGAAGMAGLLGPGAGIGGAGASAGGATGLAGGPGSAGWGMDLGGAGAADTTYAANIGAAGGGAGSVGAGSVGAGTLGAGGAVGGAGTGGGILSGLTGAGGALGSMGGMLGPLATLGGALLGSKPNTQTQTSQQKMDPRLDGAVYGAGGLVPQAQGLLNQQMDPAYQQKWLDMQKTGQGLLSNPIAGNGYSMFAGRKL